MDEELSEMLRVWGERGPTLISAVLEERKRLLDLAALHRDDLSSQLFEAQNEITMLREQARKQQNERQNERNESTATVNQLNASMSSLTKELEQAKKDIESTKTKLEQVTKERDKAVCLIDEREKSAENMMAALQKSMHSEAKTKSTARDSIHNLQQENIEYSHLVVSHRLKAEKEARRADAAERKALDLQERLDKVLTEKSVTSEDKSRTHTDPVRPRSVHAGTKRKSACSSRSEVMGPTTEDIPSEVTQHDESFHDRPTKKRIVTRSVEKRKAKVTETVKNNGDDHPEVDKSRNRCESGIDDSLRERQTKTRLVTRSAEKQKTKATEKLKDNSDNFERQSPRCQSDSERDAEPRKRHGSRKRRAHPTAKYLLLQSEKKPLQPRFDSSQPTPLTNERPRRNLPKVSYVYPVEGDADVQTRDKLFVPSPRGLK